MFMEIGPVVLTGSAVRLEPLHLKHAADLLVASQDPGIWTYLSTNPGGSLAEMELWITAALEAQQNDTDVPFAIIDLVSGRAVGSTRYMTISRRDYGLEIGWTWLAQAVRRTRVNTECKYLLLRHAFEDFNAIRVQLKTDSRNLRSQRAIERLGAVKEGILRNHMIMPDGYYRHSVYYSVIAEEWPRVKHGLELKLQHFPIGRIGE